MKKITTDCCAKTVILCADYVSRNAALYGLIGDLPVELAIDMKNYFIELEHDNI